MHLTADASPTLLYSNVVVSYNVLRACAELGIKRVCQLSSVNAIGLAFTPYHRKYHYFPLDEKHPYEPADSYALSKQICEIQADSICRAFPHMRVASIRPHACLPGLPKPLPVDPEERAREMAKYGDREALEVNDCFAWVVRWVMHLDWRSPLYGTTLRTPLSKHPIVNPTAQ